MVHVREVRSSNFSTDVSYSLWILRAFLQALHINASTTPKQTTCKLQNGICQCFSSLKIYDVSECTLG